VKRVLRWLAWTLAALLLLVLASGTWLLCTESGLRWALHAGVDAGAGKIEYSAVRGTLAGGFEVDAPILELPTLRVQAEQLSLRLRPARLWRGELLLEALRLTGARYTVLDDGAVADDTPSSRPGRLDLPLDIVLRNLELLDNQFDYGGEQPLEFSVGLSELALRAGKLSVAGLALRQGDFSVRASAAVDTTSDWSGEFSSEGEWTLPAVLHRGQLRLKGDLDALDLEMALEGGGNVQFAANLAQPLDAPGVAGRFGAQQLDLASFGIAGPVGKLDFDLAFDFSDNRLGVSGPLSIDGRALDMVAVGLELRSQQLHVERLQLGSRDVGELTLSGYWPLNPEADPGALDLALKRLWVGDWRVAEVPPMPPRVSGKLALSGYPVAWQARLDGNWSHGDPSGPLQLVASGTDQRIVVAPSSAGLAQSLVEFHGEIGLGERTALGFDVVTRALDPALLAPEWPGSLDAQVRLDAVVGATTEWKLTLAQLSGQLREAPITLSGNISGVDAHPGSGELDLVWGDGSAKILVPAVDTLRLQLAGFDLSRVGTMQGKVNGRIELPLHVDPIGPLQGLLQIDGLALKGVSAAQVRIGKQTGWALDLAADEIVASGASFSELRVALSGTAAAHRIDLSASETRGLIELGAAGSWLDPAWSGALERLQLTPTRGAQWTLADTAAIGWDGARLVLAPACLQAAAARACLGVQQDGASTRAQIELQSLSLQELMAWAPESDWRVGGELAGGGEFTVDAAGAYGGALQFAISKGTLAGGVEFGQVLDFDGQLSFDGASAALGAEVNLPGHGRMSARASGFGRPEGELNATLAITDLSFVDGLSAEVQGMRGQLDGELRAPLADPTQLQGRLEAGGLAFELPAVGLRASAGQVGLLFEGDGLLRIDGGFDIAPGKLRIEGLVGLHDGDASEIRIRGDNAGLVNLPAVQLAGDSNFAVKRNPAGLVIEGGILLRQGKIDLDRFSPAVPVSEDVVIEDAPPPPAPLPVTADISVAMIQAVDLRGFGIEASLNGGVRVTQRPGLPPRGQGEMLIKGIYNAYGQKLDIERGRLGFGGGRVDNPSLDILAVKRVDRQRVGVQVRGNAKRPVIRMYSDPSLDQSETLSYLVLGRPLATASGADSEQLGEYASALETAGGSLVAGSIGKKLGLAAGVESFGSAIGSALVVGKYLSPRFFIGYGTSLLDATQLVILRYSLTENIELEGISGAEQKASASWRTER